MLKSIVLHKPLRHFLLGIALACSLSGCMEVAHQLSLENDGSGTLTFQVRAPADLVREWEAVYREAEIHGEVLGTSPLSFNEASLRDAFRDFDPQELALEDAHVLHDADTHEMRMVVRFRSLDALASANLVDPRSLSLQSTEDGAFAMLFRIGPSHLPPIGLADPGMDFSFLLEVSLPADIRETNGHQIDARRVQWSAEGLGGKDGLIALSQLTPRVVFGSADLQIPPFGQQHIRLPGVAPTPEMP